MSYNKNSDRLHFFLSSGRPFMDLSSPPHPPPNRASINIKT